MKDRLMELIKEGNGGYEFNGILRIADHLLANGVIVPLCKVGAKVYQIDAVRVYESTVEEFTVTRIHTIFCTESVAFDETAIGKSIFLTREEAEKALERRKE